MCLFQCDALTDCALRIHCFQDKNKQLEVTFEKEKQAMETKFFEEKVCQAAPALVFVRMSVSVSVSVCASLLSLSLRFPVPAWEAWMPTQPPPPPPPPPPPSPAPNALI